jgi:hypothetical protein
MGSHSDRAYPGTDGTGDRALASRGGIDAFDSLLVRQPIREGQTGAVRDLLAAWAREADGDAGALLPVAGVHLVTLFLDRGAFGWHPEESSGDALLWYVEVADDDAPAWADPAGAIRDASPLFSAGLDDLIEGTARVHADGRDGHQLLTHATHPHRQERYETHCGPAMVAPVAGEALPIPVAVTTLPLKPGAISWLTARVVRAGNWLKRFDRVAEWLRTKTGTLEEEAMYTESLLLEPVGDRLVLHYYMEGEEMDRLYDAYEATDNWDARGSDWVMRRIFEDPGSFLDSPLESDCEVLIHAVDPARP